MIFASIFALLNESKSDIQDFCEDSDISGCSSVCLTKKQKLLSALKSILSSSSHHLHASAPFQQQQRTNMQTAFKWDLKFLFQTRPMDRNRNNSLFHVKKAEEPQRTRNQFLDRCLVLKPCQSNLCRSQSFSPS